MTTPWVYDFVRRGYPLRPIAYEPAPPRDAGPLTIAWVVPPWKVGSGGHTTICRLVQQLERRGHRCSMHVFDPDLRMNRHGRALRAEIREHFVEIEAEVHHGLGSFTGADVAIATQWWTAWALRDLPGCGEKVYLVQDDEPQFHETSAESMWAEETYRMGYRCIAYTPWMARILSERYGLEAHWFECGTDTEVYAFAGEERREAGLVAVYARRETGRRAVDLAFAALATLAERRPDLRVAIFGSDNQSGVPFPHEDLGIAAPERLAELYRRASAGVVFSLTTHSLVAHEMMASGLAIVELEGDNVESALGPSGEVAVLSPPRPDAIADALERLLDERADAAAMARRARAFVEERTWERAGDQVEAALRDYVARPRVPGLSAMRNSTRLLALALAAGGALRFATLDLQSFDHDEAVTAGRVLGGSLGDALSIIPDSERTPPLYYLLAWVWSQLFGTGEAGLRSLSAIFGTLAIGAAFLAARSLAGPRAGVLAAWLFALNPLLLWYSQQARAYALLALLATISLWLLTRALADPSPSRLAAWTVCCALALATHYFALFVVAAEALWLLRVIGPRRSTLAAVAGLGAAGLALLPLAAEQVTGNAGPAGLGSLPYRAAVAGVQFAAGENPGPRSGSALEVGFVAAAGLVWLAAAYGVAVGFRRGDDRARRGAWLTGTVGTVGVAAPILLGGVGVDVFTGPNALAALCALLLAAAIAMSARGRGRARRIAIAVVLACFAATGIATLASPELQRHDWRSLARDLGRPGPDGAIVAPPTADDPLELYLGLEDLMPAGREIRVIDLVQFEPVDDQPPEPPAAGFELRATVRSEGFVRRRYERPEPVLLTPEDLDSWEPFERDELLERSRYTLVRGERR